MRVQNRERYAKAGILAVLERPAVIAMFGGIQLHHRRMCAFDVSELVWPESKAAKFFRNQQMPTQRGKQVSRAMAAPERIERGVALQKHRLGDGFVCGAAIRQCTQQR